MREDTETKGYLDLLRKLRFVRKVEMRPAAENPMTDGAVHVKTPHGTHVLWLEIKRTRVNRPIVEAMVARTRECPQDRPWLLLAPFVGREHGRTLAENGVLFVDRVGNCYVRLGDEYEVQREGFREQRTPKEGRGVGAAGFQVLFTILARSDLLDTPLRTLADNAGVVAATVLHQLDRLEREGLIGRTRGGKRRLLEPKRILDRWLVGYEGLVRPKLLRGRFRMKQTDPAVVERVVEDALRDERAWGFGGGAAAMRLTGHFRGEQTVIHVGSGNLELPKRLGMLRHDEGPVTVLGVSRKIATTG